MIFAEVSVNGDALQQLGIAGLCVSVVLSITVKRLWVPYWFFQRVENELQEERAETKRMRSLLEEKVLPALIRSSDVQQDILDEWRRRGSPPTSKD